MQLVVMVLRALLSMIVTAGKIFMLLEVITTS